MAYNIHTPMQKGLHVRKHAMTVLVYMVGDVLQPLGTATELAS